MGRPYFYVFNIDDSMQFVEMVSGDVTGIILGNALHVLRQSNSHYMLTLNGVHRSYCCLCNTCREIYNDSFEKDVVKLIEEAKQLGVTQVFIREPNIRIEGVSIQDVGNLAQERW